MACERCSSAFGDSGARDVGSSDEQATVVSDNLGSIASSSGAAVRRAQSSSTGLLIGEIIAERYEIRQQIGQGGMGTVYKAWDRELERVIALKTIRPDLAANPLVLRRFKQELLLARQITHNNVIRIFDLGIAGGIRFITMEFVEGEDLKRYVERRGKLALEQAISIVKQICQGLQAAHSEDVIHRDLKPQNILVDSDGRVRIMDFGLARTFENTSLTRTGTLVGTADYMSPEQVRGGPIDTRSDLFAAGIIFYELLTGVLPFAAESTVAALLKRTRERARAPHLLDAAVPAWVSEIVLRCLEPDPTRRYQSARGIIDDLDRKARKQTSRPAADIGRRAAALVPGEMLGSRYRIEAEAGEGGMGKVYRATDLQLDRTVALKVVRPELTADPQSYERLKREILLASRVSHRHVLRIHDLGEADGLPFVSMAWVDGEDLERRIRHLKRLSESEIVHICQQVCEGLDAAHSQGIVHRDLKPRNILIDRQGNACISDFGAAEVLSGPYPERSGEVAGTIRYMSPEQAEGKPVDQRSDIYSLGLILYEMATADVPFASDSVWQSIFQRATEVPKNPKLLNSAISDKLAATIMRCLENNPDKRYQSACELAADLGQAKAQREWSATIRHWRLPRGRWIYAAVAALIALAIAGLAVYRASRVRPLPPANGKYVAVLPFRTLGSDPELKYDAEGIGEAISSRLFSLASVHPISQPALENVNLKQPVEAIARKVGANLVIQGTVQGRGDQILAIANIDDVGEHRRIWSKSFSGPRTSLLNIEDQICGDIISALDVRPSAEERERAATPPTHNIEAYDLYLKGRDILKDRRDTEATNEALGLFEKACNKDPSFALAWAGVADASLQLYRLNNDSFWVEKALAAAQQAHSIRRDRAPEIHFALGSVYSAMGKNAEAIQEIKDALELAPNSDNGYLRLGRAYLDSGQADAALQAFQHAVDLNSYYWYNHKWLGVAYLQMGRNEEALEHFKRQIELNPSDYSGYLNSGVVYFEQGRWRECIPFFEEAIKRKPTYDAYANLGTAYDYLHRYSEAVSMSEKAVQMKPNDAAAVSNLATAYSHAGRREKAADTFQRAIALAYRQLELNPQDSSTLGLLAINYANTGQLDKAERLIARARSINGSDNSLMYDEAIIHARAGHTGEALKALKRALENGYSVNQAREDPDLASVRSSPGFDPLLTATKR